MLLVLVGCEAPISIPDPWPDAAEPLSPFVHLLTTELPDAVSPSRLIGVPDLPSVAVFDPGAGAAWVLDARYRHSPAGWCVPLYGWILPQDGVDRNGNCKGTTAWVQRGRIGDRFPVRAVAGNAARHELVVLGDGGRWFRASTDLEAGDPFDWLRPLNVAKTGTLASAEGDALLATSDAGAFAVAVGAEVFNGLDLAGQPIVDDVGETVVDLAFVGDVLWVATGAHLRVGETTLDVAALRVAAGPTPWVSTPEGLVRLTVEGTVTERVAVEGLTGPLTVDSLGRVYAATADDVVRVEEGVVTELGVGAVQDVWAQASGEVALLRGATVEVWFDQAPLTGRAPLQIALATFFENPKGRGDTVPCIGGDDSFDDRMARAWDNRRLLDDLPATWAFAVTPASLRLAWDCDRGEELAALIQGENSEMGVLYHDDPPCEDDDQACVDAVMTEELAVFDWVGAAPTWSSGASAWDLVGTDWATGANAAGLPRRHLFYAMAALPEIVEGDPRKKEPLPWRGVDRLAPTRVTAEGGDIALYPGHSPSGFNRSGCPNLLTDECSRVDAGGGSVWDEDDLAVLSLLLHRAAWLRGDEGYDTWYAHVPAVELFDYTDGCTTNARRWYGPACEASLLQPWAFGVHTQLVLNGVARWFLPSELPEG